MEAHGGLTDILNQAEGFVAFVLAQIVAEQSSEKANIFSERQVLIESGIESVAERHHLFQTARYTCSMSIEIRRMSVLTKRQG